MDEVILRSIERIVAVGIGGLAVCLGYCLFLRVPEQRDGKGRIRLPGGASIYLARVGPGVFFALFGAAVVGLSLHHGITSVRGGANGPHIFGGLSPTARGEAQGDMAQRRLAQRLHVEFLNSLPGQLHAKLGEAERREVIARRNEIKAALMERVWDHEWGDHQAFRLWVESGAKDPGPANLDAAIRYFRAGEEGRS